MQNCKCKTDYKYIVTLWARGKNYCHRRYGTSWVLLHIHPCQPCNKLRQLFVRWCLSWWAGHTWHIFVVVAVVLYYSIFVFSWIWDKMCSSIFNNLGEARCLITKICVVACIKKMQFVFMWNCFSKRLRIQNYEYKKTISVLCVCHPRYGTPMKIMMMPEALLILFYQIIIA